MRLKANLLLDQEGVGFLLFLHGIEQHLARSCSLWQRATPLANSEWREKEGYRMAYMVM
jgi:hypothetical protein